MSPSGVMLSVDCAGRILQAGVLTSCLLEWTIALPESPARRGRRAARRPPVLAREAVLTITLPTRIALDIPEEVAYQLTGNQLSLPLGDLHAGARQRVALAILAPPAVPGTPLTIAATLTYLDLEDHRRYLITAGQTFSYAPAGMAADVTGWSPDVPIALTY